MAEENLERQVAGQAVEIHNLRENVNVIANSMRDLAANVTEEFASLRKTLDGRQTSQRQHIINMLAVLVPIGLAVGSFLWILINGNSARLEAQRDDYLARLERLENAKELRIRELEKAMYQMSAEWNYKQGRNEGEHELFKRELLERMRESK